MAPSKTNPTPTSTPVKKGTKRKATPGDVPVGVNKSPSKKTDWHDAPTLRRFITALVGSLESTPGVKLNYASLSSTIARIIGSTPSAVEYELRIHRVCGDLAVRFSEAHNAVPEELWDNAVQVIAQLFGESTPAGIAFQFREFRANAKELRQRKLAQKANPEAVLGLSVPLKHSVDVAAAVPTSMSTQGAAPTPRRRKITPATSRSSTKSVKAVASVPLSTTPVDLTESHSATAPAVPTSDVPIASSSLAFPAHGGPNFPPPSSSAPECATTPTPSTTEMSFASSYGFYSPHIQPASIPASFSGFSNHLNSSPQFPSSSFPNSNRYHQAHHEISSQTDLNDYSPSPTPTPMPPQLAAVQAPPLSTEPSASSAFIAAPAAQQSSPPSFSSHMDIDTSGLLSTPHERQQHEHAMASRVAPSVKSQENIIQAEDDIYDAEMSPTPTPMPMSAPVPISNPAATNQPRASTKPSFVAAIPSVEPVSELEPQKPATSPFLPGSTSWRQRESSSTFDGNNINNGPQQEQQEQQLAAEYYYIPHEVRQVSSSAATTLVAVEVERTTNTYGATANKAVSNTRSVSADATSAMGTVCSSSTLVYNDDGDDMENNGKREDAIVATIEENSDYYDGYVGNDEDDGQI